MSNISEINEVDFEQKVLEESSKKLIVVDFWAPWCGPCKQLTPIMEKVANENQDNFQLVKINIDDNQQIAAQLKIQSIPAVYAFRDKKIVNAFQGVISEKDFVDFIEKSSGGKLKKDMSDFYNNIRNLIESKNFTEAKDQLLEFFTENANDPVAVSMYLDCLLYQKEFEEINDFISSLDDDIKKNNEIVKIIKKIKIVKDSKSSDSIEILLEKFNSEPRNIKILMKISEYYFSIEDYEKSFTFLLNNYFKDKEKIKKKLIEFFEALGNDHEATKNYRKKLSSLLFA
ncbi:thioredoxin [Pelagibacterales bacterium SAG-MED31]|nr:thioredoxin [Pelagibacterales bacterium SAG-MED31]